jgi:hypothetical protein
MVKEVDIDEQVPLVSITVPVYNGEKFLQQTLSSLISQEHEGSEIIVVDDGSTDNTARVVEQFSFYRNLRYVKKENGGTGSAINLGHALSRGKYLTWCSADNIYFNQFINCFVKSFEQIEKQGAPIGLVYSDFLFMNEQGKVLSKVDHKKPQSGADLVAGYDIGMSFMYTKDLWHKTGPYWNRICEDFHWVVRAAQHCAFGLIQNPLAAFRVHGGQLTGSNKEEEKRAADDCKALAAHLFCGAQEPENIQDFALPAAPGWENGIFVGLEEAQVAA